MTDIKIRHQHRSSLMMRATRSGVEVFVPLWLKKDSRQVRRFIEEGLKKLEGKIPQPLPQQTSPDEIRAMVYAWAARMDLQPGRVTLRPMQRKWGSCSSRENITLNTALAWLPRHLAEYVVVHELAHLRVFNHGPDFKKLMSEYLPDWQTREQELNTYRI
jgi:predicted metal-dependent hydrolase